MSPRISMVLVPVLTFAVLLRPIQAQVPGPGGGFAVNTTPSIDPNRLPSTGPFTIPFYVVNTTAATIAGDFACSKTGPVTCGTVTPTSGNVPAHDSIAVSVTYSTTASTGAAVITLTATPDAGGTGASGNRTTNVANAGKAIPAFLNANQDNLDRGLCLTVGAGDAAGVSCGDLFVVQSMPTFRSLGRDRTLILLYNSATANDLTLVAGTVAEPNTIAMPTSIRVVVTVTVPGGPQFSDSTTYGPPGINPVCTGAPCAPYSDPQQFVVGRNLSGIGTGYYPATLTVRNIYPSVTLDSTVSGFVTIVGRKNSNWGRGWSLLGVELFAVDPSDTTRGFWLGGDNSFRVYRKPAGQPNSLVFYGAAGDAPDSLVRFDTLGVKWYRRGLRHGAAVLFDETGTHRVTQNRAGQATVFTWGVVAGKKRILSITVPPKRGTPLTYNFTWNPTTARLDSIVDPAGRRMVLTIGTDTLVSKILIRSVGDPITYETRFSYSGSRMVTRAVVRPDTFPGHLATTSYAYANSARLTSATIPYDTLSSGRTAVTTFTPWDERGLTALVLADTAGLPTRVDGPIPGTGDAADILLERFGGAKRIIGLGLNDTTLIKRADATNPGLITQVIYSNHRSIVMTWNSRANLATVRDSTNKDPLVAPYDSLPVKSTTYTYGDQTNAPDSPTKVQDALLRHSDFTYDSLGLTLQATDARGHRTKFYNRTMSVDTMRGLLDSVDEVNVMVWKENTQTEVLDTLVTSFHYDSTTGNLLWLKSPLGVITSYKLDAAGNVTDAVDPMRTRTVFSAYDLWNRVGEIDHPATKYTLYPPFNPLVTCDSTQIVCTDSLPAGVGTQFERYYLNVVGLDSTSDARGVKRRFGSDALGRVWRETDEFGKSRRVFYNAFGGVDSTRSRTNTVVKYLYDTLGRLTTRFWPTMPDSFNHPVDSVTSDSLRYTYDVMGNILAAQSRAGIITRTYYGDNSIHYRTTTIGGLDSLKYTYDATGARTRTVHWAPQNSTRDSVVYAYNSAGDLATIKAYHTGANPVLQTFTFVWDSLGRRRQVTYPNGATVSFAYDAGGTVRQILGTGTGRFNFSLRNSSVDPAGNIGVETDTCHLLSGDTFGPGSLCGGVGPQTVTSTFNRLGEVIKQIFAGQDNRTDSMKYDLSGNLTFRRRSTDTPTDRLWSIVANSDRLAKEAFLGDTFGFTANGSRLYASQSINFTEKYWYDGLGRTSGIAQTGPTAFLKPNACRYDADGQMYHPCDEATPFLAFDGPNVVTAFSDEWRFVDGPGVDDPLVGLVRLSPSGSRRLYFITDGNGRQLMVTDSAGALNINDQPAPGYPRGDWRYGGATSAANTFSSDRINPPNLPSVSLFRNRVYDQRSGRWTQEDPLGVAGGLNQYRYVGNNPVAFTDPFGLCPPQDGDNGPWCRFRQMLSDAADNLSAGLTRLNNIIEKIPLLGGATRAASGVAADGSPLSNSQRAGSLASSTIDLATLPMGGGGSRSVGKIVIGETAERVGAYATRIGAESFTPVARDFIGIMRENVAWLREKIRQGYEIIDIGIDPARTERGVFYAAERKVVERTGATVIRP